MSTWPDGYRAFPDLGIREGGRALRTLRWEDREPIRQWRNDQLEVLRQASPLSPAQQDAYYAEVLAPQHGLEEPPQVLLAFEEGGQLVGYGGFVHVSWPDRRAELSFLMATDRALSPTWADDWRAYLPLLAMLARERLRLHRLTTETYAFRTDVLEVMGECGFVREGVLRDHHRLDDSYCDSVVCGLLL